MPIAITDDHQELGRHGARGALLAKALQAARSLLESEDEPRPSYWNEMAELGWLGIHLPEELGGSGAACPNWWSSWTNSGGWWRLDPSCRP